MPPIELNVMPLPEPAAGNRLLVKIKEPPSSDPAVAAQSTRPLWRYEVAIPWTQGGETYWVDGVSGRLMPTSVLGWALIETDDARAGLLDDGLTWGDLPVKARMAWMDTSVLQLCSDPAWREAVAIYAAESMAEIALQDRGTGERGSPLLDRLRRSATARAHRTMDAKISRALDGVLTPETLTRALPPTKMAEIVTTWLNEPVSYEDDEGSRPVQLPRFEHAIRSRLVEQAREIADQIVAQRAGPILAEVKRTVIRRVTIGLNVAFTRGARQLAEGDET